MKLSTRTILNLVNALQALDGMPSPEKPEPKPFKFAPAIRMRIARNLARLNEVRVAYQKARNEVVFSHSGGAERVPPERVMAFERDDAQLLAETHEVEVTTLSEADFQLEKNDIPVAVLAALCPLMTDWEASTPVIAAPPKRANGAAHRDEAAA